MARIPVLSRRKWNRETAAHLACRTGFSISAAQWQAWTDSTLEEVVDDLLTAPDPDLRSTAPDWWSQPEAKHRQPGGRTWQEMRQLSDAERRTAFQQHNKRNREWMNQARQWWLQRMVTSPRPFEEKLALFWHGHFATAFSKVRHAYPMVEQNLMLREAAFGSWADLLEAVSADPAMLVYLDNYRSNRNKPNENYARELMELFSLGEGHYTEDDIRNSARAFTGWTLDPVAWEYRFDQRRHDPGTKRFLGESGRLGGRDIVEGIVALPRSSEYVAERLWWFFASSAPNPAAIRDIARAFREADHHLPAAYRALLMHEDFYHPSVMRSQIKSPVQLTVGLLRSLQGEVPNMARVDQACRSLGQELFNPPSVKGWDGDESWITASTLALRYQLAERAVQNRGAFHDDDLLPDRSVSREEARDQFLDRFYFSRLREQDRQYLDSKLAALPPPSDWTHKHFMMVLNHLVQQPQYQLI